MAYLASHWRIYAALLISCALVVGAYVVAKGVSRTPVAEAFTETALLQAIATKDTSGDGLPDWEKALYGIPIDSTTTDYFHLGMTDGEAVAKGLIVPRAIADVPAAPAASSTTNSGINYAANGLTPPTQGSLTDTFAKSFFTSYLAAKQQNGGVDLSVTDTQTIANQALNSLAISVASAPDFKSINDLTISESGADALRTFAADAEAVLHKNVSTATTTELVYLQYAVEGNDATARSQLASIAAAYRNTAAGLAALPVPRELAADDLVLINAMMQVSGIIGDFSRVNADPLSAMLALQQYPQVAQSFAQAYTDIGNIYATAGIALPAGAPGAAFVNMMANVSAQHP